MVTLSRSVEKSMLASILEDLRKTNKSLESGCKVVRIGWIRYALTLTYHRYETV
jgi:hypothetical protein